MSALFSTFRLRGLEFKNRIFVSPMCQYSAVDGLPNEWHLVHLGSRAIGGAALVIAEATAVSAAGRISPGDTGIWSDEHLEAWRPIARFIKAQGAVPGIQVSHAGRKASTDVPWRGGGPLGEPAGGWQPIAPSALPFDQGHPIPKEMDSADLAEVGAQFAEATRRSLAAGFEVIEIHMAHGYLLHEFLSPLSNRRADEYGGSLENRMRLPLTIARAVRDAWPPHLPVLVRVSATDWVEGGWDLPQSVQLARRLKSLGVDLIDCSTGGVVPRVRIPVAPGYQVPFARAIRSEAGLATGAVGMITEPAQTEQIVAEGAADAVLLARAFLRDPYWPLHAAQALGVNAAWPAQYGRASN